MLVYDQINKRHISSLYKQFEENFKLNKLNLKFFIFCG